MSINYEIYEDEEEGLDDELLYLQKQKRMVNLMKIIEKVFLKV